MPKFKEGLLHTEFSIKPLRDIQNSEGGEQTLLKLLTGLGGGRGQKQRKIFGGRNKCMIPRLHRKLLCISNVSSILYKIGINWSVHIKLPTPKTFTTRLMERKLWQNSDQELFKSLEMSFSGNFALIMKKCWLGS